MFKFSNAKQPKNAWPKSAPRLPDERAYVIGDIHGCYDQLLILLEKIKEHNAALPPKPTKIIFLGDLIDRGPKSKQVIDFLSQFDPDYATPVFLMGNHEEVFLKVLAGDDEMIKSWFTFGGRACLKSYGLDNFEDYLIDSSEFCNRISQHVPKAHVNFLRGFKEYIILGDYLCVHAGIRPRIKIEQQSKRDFRWIRASFLDYKKQHPYMIVHGHSVVESPKILSNRIAIDTGVYDSGTLTSLYIEDDTQEMLQTALQPQQ